MSTSTSTNHINGLKGFACMMVMIGHFIGIYKYSESFPMHPGFNQIFDLFFDSKISFVLDETFWVILFFFVSGYLVSFSKIPDIKTFAYKSVSRFLRLGIPILFAGGVIFIIQEAVGFHTSETVELLDNSIIQKAYSNPLEFVDVIKSPIDVLFFGNSKICGPYWVLREMFITSILIYLLSYIKNKVRPGAFVFITGVIFFVSMVFSNIVFAGIFGMIVNNVQFDKEKKISHNQLFWLFVLVFCAMLFFIPRSRIASVFFGALVIFVPKIKFINLSLCSKPAQFINKISFCIYSFHWPVFCSVGMLVLVKFCESLSLPLSAVLSVTISIIVTLVISVFYYFLIEKQIYKAIKKLDLVWRKKYE